MNPIVIDISHWQASVDFKKVKDGGTVGVIIKATQGTTSVDPTFIGRRQGAVSAGLLVASYHYLTKGSIAQQMAFYVKTVAPSKGSRLVIDFEDKGLTIGDLELAVKTLWELAPDCEVTVYGANGFLGALLKGAKNDTLAKCSLWVASYTTASKPTTADLNGTWPVWSLWQYSQTGSVEGVKGDCDSNRWNGSPDSLPGWFHKALVPEPKPEPKPPSDVIVTVDIAAPEGVTLKVTINGKSL